METVAVVAFWLAVGFVVYVYVGYPLTLCILPATRAEAAVSADWTPTVSLLIAAHNEAAHLPETLRNKLELDYPRDRLEIVVVSDGSTDNTDESVRAFAAEGVLLIRQEPRQGKTMALNRGREVARGEIVAFADANSLWDRGALRDLTRAFHDPRVGYATGCLAYGNPGSTVTGAGSGLYMAYENWVRRLETRVGSVVGVNGGIDAVRRSLYAPMRADHLPDFILPLRVMQQGYRVVFRPAALSYEDALERSPDEFRMRVRVSLRALHALLEMRSLLSPRYGVFAFQLLLHKVLRYAVFSAMLVALAANLMLAAHPLYRWILAGQGVFYAAATAGIMLRGRGGWLLTLPTFLVVANSAAALAFLKLLRGERQVQWTPRKGA